MTLSLTIQNPTGDGGSAGTVDLPAEVFDVALNLPLIHQVVVAQLAAARQGTASTKTRAEVRGGGKKPYRQKGTGRARQGSTRAPQFVGGGVVHGPKPRSYAQRTPKKMKAAALRAALSDRARHGLLHVVSALVDGDSPSTKLASATLTRISDARHVLVVAERSDGITWQSLRNVAEVHLLEPGQLNTYDVLVSDEVVFTRRALEVFLGAPLTGKAAEAAASSEEIDIADEAEILAVDAEILAVDAEIRAGIDADEAGVAVEIRAGIDADEAAAVADEAGVVADEAGVVADSEIPAVTGGTSAGSSVVDSDSSVVDSDSTVVDSDKEDS